MNEKDPSFHARLAEWYRRHGRHDLPWRNSTDPYTIYLSEILLQQTQVKTVLERFFFPFLERFPSLEVLAAADIEEVLKLWQGLGYYNRAVNLHKAAQACNGILPDHFEGLIDLPGIGKNTAHAVLAFAFHRPVPVLEANVKRVIHRIFALEEASPALLWEKAEALLDRDHPFDYNQAMMDLGAMICRPIAPACSLCPANGICKGQYAPENYPRKKQKKTVPIRRRNIIALADANGKYLLTSRKGKFLNGLYGFMEIEADKTELTWLGIRYPLRQVDHIGDIIQTYSHFQLQASVYRIGVTETGNEPGWTDKAAIHALPLSRADEKVLTLLG